MEAPSCASTRSPFEIPHEDIEQLCESQGFRVLRSYLANHTSYVLLSSFNCVCLYMQLTFPSQLLLTPCELRQARPRHLYTAPRHPSCPYYACRPAVQARIRTR